MSSAESTPPELFRVQHTTSFTRFEENEGFVANGHYYQDYTYWINPTSVQKHLKCKESLYKPSPFISLFSELEYARDLASSLRQKGHSEVWIARVNIMETEPYSIPIYFEDGQVDLHGRIHMATNTIFLPMHEIEPKFQLEYGTEHRSEWLALMSISPELITAIPGF